MGIPVTDVITKLKKFTANATSLFARFLPDSETVTVTLRAEEICKYKFETLK